MFCNPPKKSNVLGGNYPNKDARVFHVEQWFPTFCVFSPAFGNSKFLDHGKYPIAGDCIAQLDAPLPADPKVEVLNLDAY
jgi:hypothetical protein